MIHLSLDIYKEVRSPGYFWKAPCDYKSNQPQDETMLKQEEETEKHLVFFLLTLLLYWTNSDLKLALWTFCVFDAISFLYCLCLNLFNYKNHPTFYIIKLMTFTNFIKTSITNSTTATISMSASTTSLESSIRDQIVGKKERSAETW